MLKTPRNNGKKKKVIRYGLVVIRGKPQKVREIWRSVRYGGPDIVIVEPIDSAGKDRV